MTTNLPSLGELIAKQSIVAKTRKIHSNYSYVRCKDGNYLIHVNVLPRYKDIDFKNLTCDEAEKAIKKANKAWRDRNREMGDEKQ